LTVSQPLICTSNPDPFARGLDYLYGVRRLAIDPDIVDLVHSPQLRQPICVWIDQHIQQINSQLQSLLQLCHSCFHPNQQPDLQILAAPLSQAYGVDALCNLHSQPQTILVDVGRVIPSHWLLLVVHEYAHAHAGTPGHHAAFAQSLSHLCLGLGITLPIWQPGQEEQLRSFPPCLPTRDPLAFWRGDAEPTERLHPCNISVPDC
jgi:hypothetical protein